MQSQTQQRFRQTVQEIDVHEKVNQIDQKDAILHPSVQLVVLHRLLDPTVDPPYGQRPSSHFRKHRPRFGYR